MKEKKNLIYGVGINDVDTIRDVNGNVFKSYVKWNEMLRRCYSLSFRLKNTSYTGCSVCAEWLTFSNFKQWFDKNYIKGYQLDKDILVKGNKVYSPDTCCFVPQEINNILTKNNKHRGNFPIGVSKYTNKNGFVASLRIKSKTVYLGYYKTPKEAFAVYKKSKETYIKELANEYKEKRLISDIVYNALMRYEVSIND